MITNRPEEHLGWVLGRAAGRTRHPTDWLVRHGGFAVWLTGPAACRPDRVRAVPIRLPAHVAELTVAEPGADEPAAVDVSVVAVAEPAAAAVPPLVGLPHPASRAEQALEAALARHPWAAGRVWNQELRARSHSATLSASI